MATNEQSGQYLTFQQAEETYGIDVESVSEILEIQPIKRVPRTADYLLGVMKVRGRVVPVVDLRLKFGQPKVKRTVESAIIVVEVSGDGTESLIGLLVDSVNEVLELDADSVEPAPIVGTSDEGQLLSGMAKREDRFILLLDTQAVLNGEELEMARSSAVDEGPVAQPS